MNKWATKSDRYKAKMVTYNVFAKFRNNFNRVAEVAGVTRKTAVKWHKQGYISQTHVQKLLDSPEVDNSIKKQDCRPDIESWN